MVRVANYFIGYPSHAPRYNHAIIVFLVDFIDKECTQKWY